MSKAGVLDWATRLERLAPAVENEWVLSRDVFRSCMPFVTRLTLESGDGDALESVVSDIKLRAERKGVELKGPHPKPPTRHTVPLYKQQGGPNQFGTWEYTVYTRTIEIVDHNEFARDIAEREYPDSIHISANIEQFNQTSDS
jgi:small subunit ribosomal protein S10